MALVRKDKELIVVEIEKRMGMAGQLSAGINVAEPS
jgi:hypothetical protein